MWSRISSCLFLFLALVSANNAGRFARWRAVLGRHYATIEERLHREAIFTLNMIEAERLSLLNPNATFGEGPFSDMTSEEFKDYVGIGKPQHGDHLTGKLTNVTISGTTPSSIDWRDSGAVTDVKDQGHCGDCWAFTTTGNAEGQWKLAGNGLVSLSEEFLAACFKGDCGGSSPRQAGLWTMKMNGGEIPTEKSFPYTSGSGSVGSCKSYSGMPTGAKITGYVAVPADESQMKTWVGAHGPLAVAVDANDLQHYKSGVMSTCTAGAANHAVLLIGYSNSHYWLIKNSWGTNWGEKGFARLQFGSNQCNIKSDAGSNCVKGRALPGCLEPCPDFSTYCDAGLQLKPTCSHITCPAAVSHSIHGENLG
jgi:cysteine peptidase B